MYRAAYSQGWLRERPNCHPVHPMKHVGMLEEFERNHINILSWCMMGSGAISLPFLERQIDEAVSPQLRFNGFMNDREFNEECLKRGILPYAVVYQAQAWEFPVVLSEGEDEILEMNILRSGESSQWYGLREFTRDTYPRLFPKSFRDYFPGGLTNSLGEAVTDLWEECSARRLDGTPAHSRWVEVEGLWATCHGACRNNPVWRAYLKKTVEIIIDAGVRAIQLDESETPICSLGDGGCFCKDCMAGFREYLIRLRGEGRLPQELADADLEHFDYGAFLRERGVRDWPRNFSEIPHSALYWDYMVEAHNKHFREIIRHVKDYGRSRRGADIKVSGNFTNMHLLYLPCLEELDCCTTELRRTVLRRHNWFRLAAGYTGEKPLILAESPYDAFIPKFAELIRQGKGDDYYRLFAMEAAAHGCCMAMPSGCWMGNKTPDSFYPPREAGQEVQEFLYRNENLLGKRSGANVLVLYDCRSNLLRDFHSGSGEQLAYTDADDLLTYRVTYDKTALRMPFNEVTQGLVDRRIPFDVKILGDDRLIADAFTAADLADYDLVVAPDCAWMTENQAAILEQWARDNPLFVYGRYAENIAGALEALRAAAPQQVTQEIADPRSLEDFLTGLSRRYEDLRALGWDNDDVYVQQALTGEGRVLHLLNYAFDRANHRTAPAQVILTVRGAADTAIETRTLGGAPLRWERLAGAPGELRLKICGLPAYGAVILRDKNERSGG